ncbi:MULTISPECIES: gephyrin-like molybdotransferase Glp [unclassified Stenotrophomonas]|uniref:molybdopterin molybdotransferase MoeA n=1 Tax=unclassified Stenotrophomonas TaxID=196198 RepID=UPI000D177E67|nr:MULTISPECIES: gephyrin-like molybdotransferase Glp [unclassified Stenotrophomonas]PTA72955.1 molybdopterin molybdenumtransferase MoeA [Stenotrophomonas sp. Nf1]PTA78884.1 molybdopterin molybdenumtransferase MoeA [Stenotrophomonas sp. Nf4]
MIAYSEALQHLLDAAMPLPAEHLPLHEAAGRILASDIHSAQSLPPFDNSAMDGFALRAEGRVFESGAELAVQGWQAAGDASAEGGEGAWEIMTGARMPSGLDTVVPIENVRILASEAGRPTRVALTSTVKPGQNVRLRGQDVSAGDRVLQAGQTLDINARTLLHALGVGEVAVVARPQAAVIATGKELVTEAAQALESGQIRDSNRPYLVGRLQAAGAAVVWQGTVGDDEAAFNTVLDEALGAGAQLLISTGAVSAGRYDFIPDALAGRGARIVFHKVAIRPGKPLLFAVLPNGALYFGLPGNPVSAAVGQRFFVEPVLRRLLGLAPEAVLQLPLQADVRKPPGLRFHARARVEVDAQGRLSARVLSGQESFRLMSMLQANAWVVLEADGDLASAGTYVRVQGWGHHEPVQLVSQET